MNTSIYTATLNAIASNDTQRLRGLFAQAIASAQPGGQARQQLTRATNDYWARTSRGGAAALDLPAEVRPFVDVLPAGSDPVLVLDDDTRDALERLAEEHARAEELYARGFAPCRRILFTGPPGTGKTTAAHALAARAGCPMYVVRTEILISGYMGATGARLAKLVEAAQKVTRGVWFFDEFDALGGVRGGGGDNLDGAGRENTRITTALLTLLDGATDVTMAFATNRPTSLDPALRRRMDAAVAFRPPTAEQAAEIAGAVLEPLGVAPAWLQAAFARSDYDIDHEGRRLTSSQAEVRTRAIACGKAIVLGRLPATEDAVVAFLRVRA